MSYILYSKRVNKTKHTSILKYFKPERFKPILECLDYIKFYFQGCKSLSQKKTTPSNLKLS